MVGSPYGEDYGGIGGTYSPGITEPILMTTTAQLNDRDVVTMKRDWAMAATRGGGLVSLNEWRDGACPECGAPWRRVVEKPTGGTIGKSWHPHENDSARYEHKPWDGRIGGLHWAWYALGVVVAAWHLVQ